jgi:hypothetical protein
MQIQVSSALDYRNRGSGSVGKIYIPEPDGADFTQTTKLKNIKGSVSRDDMAYSWLGLEVET